MAKDFVASPVAGLLREIGPRRITPRQQGSCGLSDLTSARVTASMSVWLVVAASEGDCLFGFAERHEGTGGLSWVLSTPIVEFSASQDRARTESGRVYSLGRHIGSEDLDEEGRLALQFLLNETGDYPGRSVDLHWVFACKIGRHLRVETPPRVAHAAVKAFLEQHLPAYLARRLGSKLQ